MTKRLLKKQMMTIVITVIVMIAIAIIAKNLMTNGLGGLFTIKAYREAFTIQEYDIYMIKLYSTGLEIFTLCACYINLHDNVLYERDLKLFGREG